MRQNWLELGVYILVNFAYKPCPPPWDTGAGVSGRPAELAGGLAGLGWWLGWWLGWLG